MSENGQGFTSGVFNQRRDEQGLVYHLIKPGKPKHGCVPTFTIARTPAPGAFR